MKKILSLIVFALLSATLGATAATYNITPKAPKITPSLKPIIIKYKKGDSYNIYISNTPLYVFPGYTKNYAMERYIDNLQ